MNDVSRRAPSAASPMTAAEKDAITRAEYYPAAHRIGLVTSLIHVLIVFLPPLYLMVFHGAVADWPKIMEGTVTTWSTSLPMWFIEPLSYFLVLGVCGTYIGFLAGNVANFRLPVSAVAQEAAQVAEGSTEGEIVSTVAIVATQVMLTLSALSGAIFVGAIVGLLPATVIAAFDWLLPSIWGALVVQFGMRNWRYAVVAVGASILVVTYSGLPPWTHTALVVVLMVFLAAFTYKRRVWMSLETEEKD